MTKPDNNLRERILEASRAMLLSDGYKSLSMRKIAKDTGVSATSIYLHFENKDHLLHTLMEQAIEKLSDSLESALVDTGDPADRIEAIIRGYVRFAMDNQMEYQVIYLVRTEEMARYPKEKFRKVRKPFELLAKAISEGVEIGLLVDDHPLITAYSIWGQLHGIVSVVMNNRLDNRIKRDEFIESSIEHILHGFLLRASVN